MGSDGRQAEVPRAASGMVSLLSAFDELRELTHITWVSPQTEQNTEKGVAHLPSKHRTLRVPTSEETLRIHTDEFSNQALWPICHQVFQKPKLSEKAWLAYDLLNREIATALASDIRNEVRPENTPMVLVQDYHFSRIPYWLKRMGIDAKISVFWHIPWPSVEALRILPWHLQILDSLALCDAVGFHTQEDVDRYHLSLRILGLNPSQLNGQCIPAGPEDPPEPQKKWVANTTSDARHFLAIGLDRLDYTKGIEERFHSIDLLLSRRPELRGSFTLLQVACPTRTHLPEYRALASRIRRIAESINLKYAGDSTPRHPPIRLLERVLGEASMAALHRRADLAVVTPLHDGMNLVAKEHILHRGAIHDRSGALVLSQFAGAAFELKEAFLVNPFLPESICDGIERAMDSSALEKRSRMAKLVTRVKAWTATDWARRLIDVTWEPSRRIAAL